MVKPLVSSVMVLGGKTFANYVLVKSREWSPHTGISLSLTVSFFPALFLSPLFFFFSVRIQQEISHLEARKGPYQNPIMLAL